MSEVSDDCLVWTEEQNGEYSVRTGYKLLMREREDGRRHGTRESWSSLWKIRAPPKAKHLLWRICRDCLPTTVRLRQHYVPCTSICQLCEEEVEDEWHVLFGCTASSQSWTAAGLSSIINSRLLEFTDVKNLIHDICSKENKELAGRFAVMVWSLWNNRNNWIWNNEKSEASQLGKQAFSMWKEWFDAQHVQSSIAADNQHQQQHVWQKPRDGWMKCNVDAGFHTQRNTTNRGWCIRDGNGRFICAGTAWDYGTYSTIEAEALALKEAVQAAIQMNMEKVIFESDSQLVVQAIHANYGGQSEFSLLISSIKSLLVPHYNFEVKFVKRQANSVAHLLAKAANSWSRHCFFNLIPRCIEQQLFNEMS
jgi:ribonuclease HI